MKLRYTNTLKREFSLVIMIMGMLTFMLITGCENSPSEIEDYDFEPNLSAFLVNGEPVEEIWLERMAPLLGYYDPSQTGISDADVVIFGGGDTLHMVEDPDSLGSGRYIPAPGEQLVPRSLINYRIEIDIPGGEHLWAESQMPGIIEQVEIGLFNTETEEFAGVVQEGDTLTRDMPNLIFGWTDVDSARGFLGRALNLEPRESLIPLDPDWDPNDPDDEIEDEDRNRVGWTVMHESQNATILPWLYFQWEGWHRIDLAALCQGYYDYLFSYFRVQQGLINQVESNVHGGLGIFGSSSKFSINIYMQKVTRE